MKLGQKVGFKKELKKGENVELDNSFSYYKYKDGIRWGTVKHQEYQKGIICGKRTIVYKGYTDTDEMIFIPEDYREVYLVATNMRGFHRVPKQWLEVVQ